MTESTSPKPDDDGDQQPQGLFSRPRWLPFILTFAVYMLSGMFDPGPPECDAAHAAEQAAAAAETDEEADEGGQWIPTVDRQYYPIVYAGRIALTIGAILLVLPVYRQFPFRLSPWAFAVGVVGVALWLGLCYLNVERFVEDSFLGSLIGMGARTAFDPFSYFESNTVGLIGFLAVRFLGLVLVVALIEEFFLRGFVMRYVVDPDFWKVPFGTTTLVVVITGVVYAVVSHPAELLAAAVWFSLVTWLMNKTRNIWDCVAAHATTNLLLGLHVVYWGQWELW